MKLKPINPIPKYYTCKQDESILPTIVIPIAKTEGGYIKMVYVKYRYVSNAGDIRIYRIDMRTARGVFVLN